MWNVIFADNHPLYSDAAHLKTDLPMSELVEVKAIWQDLNRVPKGLLLFRICDSLIHSSFPAEQNNWDYTVVLKISVLSFDLITDFIFYINSLTFAIVEIKYICHNCKNAPTELSDVKE